MEPKFLRYILPAPSGAWPRRIIETKGGGGGGPVNSEEPITLGLGICAGGESRARHVIKQEQEQEIEQGKSAFTSAQLHEFQHQALIFKHLVAGCHVPVHLVLPIWKSVANSFGSSDGRIYDLYPSLGFIPRGFDYGSMMDPEPGRCRRTDGKKWRCSRSVVEDKKYCERHMHRGRQRSRKHVEASKISPESVATTAISSVNTNITIDSNSIYNTNVTLSMGIPVNLQLMTPSSGTGISTTTSAAVPTNSTPTSTSTSTVSINETKYNVDDNKGSKAIITPDITHPGNNEVKSNVNFNRDRIDMGTRVIADGSRSECRNDDFKDEFRNHYSDNNNQKRNSNYGNSGKFGGIASPGFGFSPRSVLQGLIGCGSQGVDKRNSAELELHRCRRTDGKKWRCHNGVIPHQKYCERHINRGARKPASREVTVASSAPSSHFGPPPSLAIIPKKAANDHLDLNTNLSISITASPLRTTAIVRESVASAATSSSDATTISDEISSSKSHRLALSP